MRLLRGFVQGVIEKQGKNSKYAVVGINSVSKSRNGFDETTLFEFMVAGNDFTQGLHNAYRQHEGAEVFAPFSDEIDTYNGNSRIRYNLVGAPIRLQEAPAQQRAAATSTGPQAATPARAAG
ncbi:hypothetical protein D3C85_1431440 [compost metagenome]